MAKKNEEIVDPQVPTRIVDGREYPCFVAAKNGTITVPILDSVGETIAKLRVLFGWESKGEVLRAIEYDAKEITTVDGGSKQAGNDPTMLNAEVFRSTAQKGWLTPFENGEFGEETELSHSELMDLEEEIQASVVRAWLMNFHLTIVDGDRLAALFRHKAETVILRAAIGSKESPTHVIDFEFSKPSLDFRREFRTLRQPVTSVENGKTVTTFPNLGERRMQACFKFLKDVQGAATLADDGSGITTDFNPKRFAANFNPVWAAFLTTALLEQFDRTGK